MRSNIQFGIISYLKLQYYITIIYASVFYSDKRSNWFIRNTEFVVDCTLQENSLYILYKYMKTKTIFTSVC
jgi:hypothetical protein